MKLADTIQNEYSSLEEKKMNNIQTDTEKISVICSAYEYWLRLTLAHRYNIRSHEIELYHLAHNEIKKVGYYTAEEITAFSCRLQEYQDYEKKENHIKIGFSSTGIFLSKLINHKHQRSKKDNEKYVLLLQELKKPIDGLGFKLYGADVQVHGNLGNFSCNKVKNGKITIHGNVGMHFGKYISGGSIHIFGDANHSFCQYMNQGEVTLEGNLIGPMFSDQGYHSAHSLHTGKIHIKKDADYIGNIQSGNICIDGNCSRLEKIWGGTVEICGELTQTSFTKPDHSKGKVLHQGKRVFVR